MNCIYIKIFLLLLAVFLSACANSDCADCSSRQPEKVPTCALKNAPKNFNAEIADFFAFEKRNERYCGKLPDSPTGAPDFEVQLPRNTGGKTVYAADFGFNESNPDCAAAINRALDYCKKTRASKLVLARGTYKCFGKKGILIDSMEDFEFDGMGATLVFRRPSDFSILPQYAVVENDSNFLIKNCKRVKISNINSDWDWETDPLGAFVRIISKHPSEGGKPPYFDVEFIGYDRYPLYGKPTPVQVMMPMADSMDSFGMGAAFWFGPSEGHFGSKCEWLSPNTARIYHSTKAEGLPMSSAYDHLFTESNRNFQHRAAKVGGVYRLMHYYYGKNAFNLDSNEHLTLENIEILSCRGMGVHIGGSQKYWQMINLRAGARGGGKIRPCSTTADVVHSTNSLGYCKMIGCSFSLNQDDVVNFHDRTTFAKKISKNEMQIVNSRGNYYFGAQAGDIIDLYEADCSPTGFSAKIIKIDGENLYLDSDVPEAKGAGFLVSRRSGATDNLLVKDCVFENYYGRAIFQGRNVTVENCVFKNGPSIPLKFQTAFTLDKWVEGRGVSNVVVRGCTFEDNNFKMGKTLGWVAEIFFGASIDSRGGFKIPSKSCVDGILIEKNIFKNVRGLLMYANAGRNIIFRDNEIIGASSEKCSYAASIFAENVENAYFINNLLYTDSPAACGVIVSGSKSVVACGNALKPADSAQPR